MKRFLLYITILFIYVRGFSQPVIVSPSFPSSVGLFDLFEVSFSMGTSYANPYDPDTISVYALFLGPDNSTFRVNAFYYEDYSFQYLNGYEQAISNPNNNGWRIRFTPNCIGTWKFRIVAEESNGAVAQMPNDGPRQYSFVCNSVTKANGFISKANARYLKRDVVRNGVRQNHSFFPIGPNIACYSCIYENGVPDFTRPKGIYDYIMYIDSLTGNANYMRIFLNRYQYLSLYGPEYTQLDMNGDFVVYFDRTINQKDSAELDYIITYAIQNDVAIMPCMFNFIAFNECNVQDPNDPTIWSNNPFNTVLGLESPCEFFSDDEAVKISKNLIRYIVSRWGYATNIMSWELWNEVGNMFGMCNDYETIDHDVRKWHDVMAEYITSIDPFGHCITTSTGNVLEHPIIYSNVFQSLDIVQQHNYQNIQKAKSKEQISYILYLKTNGGHVDYSSLPFFMGEFGFGQGGSSPKYADKDPFGIDLHNSLWSSLFSTSIGPASLWWWSYIRTQGLFKRFSPLLHFCEELPILSETFTAHQTGIEEGYKLVFPNNIETYYMINGTEDTIYGWCQDTAFAYQSLRWLTDSVRMHSDTTGGALHFVNNGVFDPLGYVYTLDVNKRPGSSSNNNSITIPIMNQPVGTAYKVKWYNSETGLPYNSSQVISPIVTVQQDAYGSKFISFSFPPYIRNLQQQVINNTFGDAVFVIRIYNISKESNSE